MHIKTELKFVKRDYWAVKESAAGSVRAITLEKKGRLVGLEPTTS
jgi:hypothetical protein